MTLHRLGVVVHGGKKLAIQTAGHLRRWAASRNIEVKELDVWGVDAQRKHAKLEAKAAGLIDLVVTIGGDGTFLRGLRVAAAADVPVLGVDVGRVGFLTEVHVGQMVAALEAFESGSAVIEKRLTLTMRANRALEIPTGLDSLLAYDAGPSLPPPALMAEQAAERSWGVALDVTALNDVVFEKLSRDRQASLAVYIGGRLFVSYSADALIVATPTGSTAYSFAAGGPVVSPRAEALVFTPVAAHMTFGRSLVVAADDVIAVRVLAHSGAIVVTVDGQVRGVLQPGDWVAVYARPWRARLVRLCEPDFFGRLRERFQVADATATVQDEAIPMFYQPDGPIPADLQHLHLPTVQRPSDDSAAAEQPGS